MALKLLSNTKNEHYWSIIIEPGFVQAAIWKVTDGKVEVISTSPSGAWEMNDELITATDAALTSCIQELPSDVEDPEKTVFGVASSWVLDGNIKDEYIDKIKKLCEDLTLIPSGFVVLPDAIANYVKTEETHKLNAVTIGIFEKSIEITLFNFGKPLQSFEVSRSVNLYDDVIEGLTRFKSDDSIPSRFILYNGKLTDLEEARKSLVKSDWDSISDVKFLHTPKVEVFGDKQKAMAVSLAGATEIANASEIYEKREDEEVEDKSHEDVARDRNVTDVPRDEIGPQDVGFVIDEDIDERDVKVEDEPATDAVEEDRDDFAMTDIEQTLRRKGDKKSGLKTLLIKLKFPKKEKTYAPPGPGKRVITTGIFAFTILVGGLAAAYWFLPKADVSVFVTTKRLEETFELNVNSDIQDVDSENRLILGKVIKKSISGERTKSTTGTKTVGDKATGEVKLFRVGSELSLDSGSVLTGPNNLKFTLDEDVTIASGSASSPGEITVKVTAGDIGAEYNLSGGTTFGVSNYSSSDIEAKNSDSFTGGSSREINAVDDEDQIDLEDKLTSELLDKFKEEINQEISSDELLLDESFESEIEGETFSANVGDEADTLKLELTLTISVVVAQKAHVYDVARLILKDQVPDGFVLKDDQIDLQFESLEKNGDNYSFSINIVANLLPNIDPDEVALRITGKDPAIAKEYFTKEVPGFVKAEIVFLPDLPGKLATLPHVTKNINLEIAAAK